MDDVEQVTKGGTCWLQIALTRRAGGLEIWLKADPRVEKFMAALQQVSAPTPLSAHGRNWAPVAPTREIMVYTPDVPMNSRGINITTICGPLSAVDSKGSEVINLSFLRFVDISSGEGVRFCIEGPFSKSYVRDLKEKILAATLTLLKEYVVPIQINLRITSQE